MSHPIPLVIITRAKAKALGLKRYFTGKPCSKGHISERIVVSWSCVQCDKIWRAENKEKSSAWTKSWNVANKDKKASQNRIWESLNRELVNSNHKLWRANNKEKSDLYRRTYEINNPEKILANNRTKRARRLNAEGRHTAAEIKDLANKQKNRCAACKISIKNSYHADHIIALANGGTNWISNIQLLCRPCNQRKGAKDPIAFMQSLGKLL